MLLWIAQRAHAWIQRIGVNQLIILLMTLTLGFVSAIVWWRMNPSVLSFDSVRLPESLQDVVPHFLPPNDDPPLNWKELQQNSISESWQDSRLSEPPAWLGLVTQVEYYLESCRERSLEIAQQIEQLVVDEAGCKIAADIQQARNFYAVQRYLANQQSQLASLETRNDKVQADTYELTLDPSEDKSNTVVIIANLQTLSDDLAMQLVRFQDVQSAIHAIEFSCRENAPHQQRLADVLDEEKNRLALDFAAASAQRDREAQADRKQKLSEANAKHDGAIGRLERAKRDLRTQQDQLETTRQQLEAQLNAERTRWRQQVAQLEAEFNRDLPSIRRYLAPFLEQGYSQPYRSSSIQAMRKGPMSLQALTAAGVFDESYRGLVRLAYVITAANDRPSNPIPDFIGGTPKPHHLQYLRAAQSLLIKYQYLLVENGMLAE